MTRNTTLLDSMVYYHKFFVKESYSFMKGTGRINYYCYYPIAYCKFMYSMYQHYILYKKIK